MNKTFANVTYMGESYPIRILNIDRRTVEISVESLNDALTRKDGSIANKRIDDMITYYVPDLCINLSDEELIAAMKHILNATGEPEMYFVVEETSGIMRQYSKYKDLRELVIAHNIHGIKDTLTGMIEHNKIKGDPKKHVFVKREVELLEECLEMCNDGEILLHDGRHIIVRFDTNY